MLIGNLPRGYDPSKNDVIVFSKDGVHLLKIPYQDFLKGVGGSGLKYWKEDENSIKRYINASNEYSYDEYFKVDGNAELVVAYKDVVTIGDPAYEIRGYCFGDEGGYYILRRTSDKPVIGGALYYRLWGDVNSRLTDLIGANNSRLDFGLPGWLLMSTDRRDLEYEFIFRDLSGNEEVLQTVSSLADGYEINGLTFYVNGYVDPTLYEDLFIQYHDSEYVFKPDTLPFGNNIFNLNASYLQEAAAFYYKRPNGIFENYYTVISDISNPNVLPSSVPEKFLTVKQFAEETDSGQYPLRSVWVDKQLTETVSGTTYNYDKLKNTKVSTLEFTLDDCNFIGYEEHAQVPSVRTYTNVIYWIGGYFDWDMAQGAWPQDFNQFEHETIVSHGNTYERFSFPNYPPIDNPSLGIGMVREQAYTNAFQHSEFAFLGSVMNIGGIPYAGSNEIRKNKDAIHYVEHDGDVLSLGYALTYLGCNPGQNGIAFAAGYLAESTEEPNPNSMAAIIFNDGKYYGNDYYLKEGDEYISVRDLSPSGYSHILLATSSPPSDDDGEDGDICLIRTNGKAYKYLKFEIYGQKGTNNYTQLAELNFTNGTNSFNFTGSVVSCNIGSPNAGQTAACLVDGFTTSVALWQYKPTTNNRIIVNIDLYNPINLYNYKEYQLYTAADVEARDPASWALYCSNDKTNWTLLDDVPGYQMPSTRTAIGYSQNIRSAIANLNNYYISKRYYKYNGHWIPILG